MKKRDIKRKLNEIIERIDGNTVNIVSVKKLLEQQAAPGSPPQEELTHTIRLTERNYNDLVELYGCRTERCLWNICNDMITDAIIRGSQNDKSRIRG